MIDQPVTNLLVSAGVSLWAYLKAVKKYIKSGDVMIIHSKYGYLNGKFNDINEIYVDMVGVKW